MGTISEGMLVRVGADISHFQRQMQRVRTISRETATKISNIGRIGTAGLLVATKAAVSFTAALTGAVAMAVKLESNFEKALAEISTLYIDVAGKMEGIRKAAIKIATDVGEAPVRIARAIYQTVSAGITAVGDAVILTRVASKAAVAALTTTEAAVDILTSSINAYADVGANAAYYSDILFTSVRLGKLRFDDLVQTLGRALPMASLLGVTFEEVNAAVVTMTRGGIRADIATTYLRAALVALARPTQEAIRTAKEYGIAWGAAAVRQLGFVGVLKQVHEKLGDNVAAMARLASNVRATTAIAALAGNQFDTLVWVLKDMGNASGATERAFYRMTQTISFQWARLVSSAKTVGIGIGKILGITVRENVLKLADVLAKSGEYLEEFTDEARAMFRPLTDWMNRAADAAIAFYNKLGGAPGLLLLIKSGVDALRIAFNALGVAVSGVGVLVLGSIAAWQVAFSDVGLTAKTVWKIIEVGALRLTTVINKAFMNLFDAIAQAGLAAAEEGGHFSKVWASMSVGASKAREVFIDLWKGSTAALEEHKRELRKLTDEYLRRMSKTGAGKAMEWFMGRLLTHADRLGDAWGNFWSNWKMLPLLRESWKQFKGFVENAHLEMAKVTRRGSELTAEEAAKWAAYATSLSSYIKGTYRDATQALQKELRYRLQLVRDAERKMELAARKRQQSADEWQERWFRAITTGMPEDYITRQHVYQARWYERMARNTADYDRKVQLLNKSLDHWQSVMDIIGRDPTILRHMWNIGMAINDIRKQEEQMAAKEAQDARKSVRELLDEFEEMRKVAEEGILIAMKTGQATEDLMELANLLDEITENVYSIFVGVDWVSKPETGAPTMRDVVKMLKDMREAVEGPIEVKVDTARAVEGFREIKSLADWITEHQHLVVTSDVDRAVANLKLVQARLDRLKDKTITITTQYVEKRQAGGFIGGHGGTDTVPALLTPGEFVVNREATARYLPLLQAINSGMRQSAFAAKMQSGGAVTNANFGNININVATLDRRTLQHEVLPTLRQIIDRKRI